jgi:hypothetical protein
MERCAALGPWWLRKNHAGIVQLLRRVGAHLDVLRQRDFDASSERGHLDHDRVNPPPINEYDGTNHTIRRVYRHGLAVDVCRWVACCSMVKAITRKDDSVSMLMSRGAMDRRRRSEANHAS